MILRQIREAVLRGGDAPAFCCAQGTLSYRELGRAAEAFRQCAAALPGEGPVLLWGKKQRFFPAAMLGCAFAGVCYLPVDSSIPPLRLQALLKEAKPRAVWTFEPFPAAAECTVSAAEELLSRANHAAETLPECEFSGNRPLYCIYTSGSTGVPKGVVITHENLDCFVPWMQSFCRPTPAVVLNQASFSFDLSVADFYQAFSTGACLTALEPELTGDFPALFSALQRSKAELMVCTPSFVSLLLADHSFNSALMNRLSTVFFCGEVLPPATVQALWERFPGLRIINAYGPTECTVAVSALEILPEHLSAPSLPVGFVRPGTGIAICAGAKQCSAGQSAQKKLPLPEGAEGEIVIFGQGISPGYANLRSDAFGSINGMPAYFTGDRGILKNGMLYFCGRTDRQVKLHGFRIELDDVEQNLLALPGVAQGAVIAEQDSSGAVKRLRAFAVLQPGENRSAAEVRRALCSRLAPYMVPAVTLLSRMPLNRNGKLDRAALTGIAAGEREQTDNGGDRNGSE